MSQPHLHAALELLHAANLRANRAEATITRIRAVLDTSRTDIAAELDAAIRDAIQPTKGEQK